ncbi:hypothetical protein EDD68_11187 [Melghiribacillus thermohalophilus]|uniref:Uncharacterized protein n=1 Tax=Melghiribacillus thermohalophilus TaxID=1324956 RepID=A0A4R3MZS1_9BACI|nr:hypothetical protein EDD68_11187 [Melghiribacillus thermohalophilus]
MGNKKLVMILFIIAIIFLLGYFGFMYFVRNFPFNG